MTDRRVPKAPDPAASMRASEAPRQKGGPAAEAHRPDVMPAKIVIFEVVEV